jgi:hypothetical protein
MRVKIVTTATTARNKVARAASADKCVKDWELVAEKLSKAGWNLGWVSALDSEGRTMWIRVYDEAGNVIETHEHQGDFKEW